MKKALCLITALIMILSLVSCGKSPADASGSGSGNEVPVSSGTSGGDSSDMSGEPSADGAEPEAAEDPWAGHDTDELTWEYKDYTVYIHGEGPMRDYDLDYPEWYDYAPTASKIVIDEGVTTVGMYAFADFMELTEITLPSTVTAVGPSAFDYCWSLRTVNLPDSVTYIGSRAFYNTLIHEPETFVLPENLEYIGDEAFHSAFKLCSVEIPASVKYIGTCAFGNGQVTSFTVADGNPSYASVDGVLFSKDMTTIIQFPYDSTKSDYVIPESVKRIEPECFNVTDYLRTLTIGSGVESIAEGSIFYNYALTDIFVDEDSSSFKSVDGVLFTADGKELLAYPNAKEADGYTVPEGTERICDWVFANRYDITEISLPSSLKTIGESAFEFCDSLTSVYLSENFESVEPYAFGWCYGIEDVFYGGTEEQWNGLDLNSEYNDGLFYGTVHFECDPA